MRPRSAFVSELKMYIDYLGKEIRKTLPTPSPKQLEYLNFFKTNLLDGIQYYKDLIPKLKHESEVYCKTMTQELHLLLDSLELLFKTSPLF